MGDVDVFEFSNENIFVRFSENIRARDVFIVQTMTSPGEHAHHGAVHHDRRRPARLRRPHHRRHSLLPLRPQRQEGPAPRPDHRPPDRQLPRDGGRRPPPDGRPARRPDPGLLQHPGRRADGAVHSSPATSRTSASRTSPSSQPTSAAPRARGAWPTASTRPLAIVEKRRIGNEEKVEAMNIIGEVEGRNVLIVDDEVLTGGTLVATADVSHRARRDRRLRRRHARHPRRRRRRADREGADQGARLHGHDPHPTREEAAELHGAVTSPRYWARPSAASTPANPSAPSSTATKHRPSRVAAAIPFVPSSRRHTVRPE